MGKRKAMHRVRIDEGSGNVYADLEMPDSDAMLIKAQLVTKIAERLKHTGLTQAQAGQLLGLPQPKVSRLLKGQFRGISERRLMDCLTRLKFDVQVVVRPAPRRRDSGKLSVVFA